MIPQWAALILAAAGLAAVVAGVTLIFMPAGLIVAGILALCAGLLIDSGRHTDAGRPRGR